jgi:hypothetical protein
VKRLSLALALLLAGALAAAPVAQERPQQQPPPGDPSDFLNTLLGGLLGFGPIGEAELQREVAEAGGIPFRRDVPIDFISHERAAKYFEELFDSEYPVARASEEQRLLRVLDLLPQGTDLRKLRARLLLDNVIGFYDERPGRKKLYAVSADRTLTPTNQLVLAHELRHALQDQYIPIHELLPASLSDFDDRRLALLALLEGDATFVMQRYLTRRLPEGIGGGLESAGLTLPSPEMPGTPAVLRDQLVLPYTVGLEFARAVFARGGWPAMLEAFARPPDSTEQVLHAEKFFERETPRIVELSYLPAGGRPIGEGVLGELLTRSLLGEGRDAAAAGWGGDIYRAFDVSGKTLVLARSVWDSPADQREFLEAVAARFRASHGEPKQARGYRVFRSKGSLVAVGEWLSGALLVASDDESLLHATLLRF